MWGLFRLFLALTVVVSHARMLDGGPLDSTVPGAFAVEAFFTISGYVITKAIRRNYADGLGGFVRFWQNRALRLMPPYWVAFALAVAIASTPLAFPGFMREPVGLGWFPAALIVGQTGLFHLTPGANQPLNVSWTLAVEVFYYFVMSAWAARSFRNAAIFLGATLLLAAVAVVSLTPIAMYCGIAWQGLPFAAGCFLAWSAPHARVRGAVAWFALVVALVFVMIAPANVALAYLCAPLTCAGIIACESIPQQRAGRFMADLSYPVYIIQFPAMALIRGLHGWAFVIAAPLATVAAAILINRLVEAPIAKIRARIRHGKAAPAFSAAPSPVMSD